jgi:cation:H+ antiporter
LTPYIWERWNTYEYEVLSKGCGLVPLSLTCIILGFILLAWSADHLVEHASLLAKQLGVSPFVVGVTVIGFGTSAPELLVSAIASITGNGGLAVGNALGSNIANIGLVLGSCSLAIPLVISNAACRRELPLVFLAALFAWILCLDGTLSRLDGLALGAGLIGFLYLSVKTAVPMGLIDGDEPMPEASIPRRAAWIVGSVLLLVIASRVLIFGAVGLATKLGVSQLLIGLTVIALGTSLPELAASFAGARKGLTDMVVGNIIGSNIFNSLGVLGVAGMVRSTTLDADALRRDFPVMIAFTLAMWAFGITRSQISRTEGIILLAAFIGYMAVLCIQSL